jgi:flavin-dependent dehydrogenase
LPPEINPVLQQLSLHREFDALGPLPAHGILSAWGDAVPAETDFIRNVYGCGWHVDRRTFDRMLLREAERAGVEVQLGRRCEVRRSGEGFWLAAEYRSRFLVDATGRNGLRIDDDALRQTDDELIAIALTLDLAHSSVAIHPWTSIEATPNGWWYSAPIPNRGAVAMFFTDPAIYREEGIVLAQQLDHAGLAARCLSAGRVSASRVLRAASSCRKTIDGNRWLAVGDSAVSLDPLSGRGIFNALRWADPAAEAIASCLDQDGDALPRFSAEVRRQYAEYVRQRRVHYSTEQRWTEHRFWRGRRQAVA